MPKEQKMRCVRCGRLLRVEEFYRRNCSDGRIDTCKDCFLRGVRNNDPATFVPLLKELDYPFVERKWVEVANTAFAKKPEEFGPASVFGPYVRNMNMKRSHGYRFEDSKLLEEKLYGTEEEQEENREEMAALLEAGQIDEDQYVVMTGEGMTCDIVPPNTWKPQDRWKAPIGSMDFQGITAKTRENASIIANPMQALGDDSQEEEPQEGDAQANDEASNETLARDDGFVYAEDLPQAPDGESLIRSQLTDDDVRRMGVKWGVMYKPSEWVKMEELYQQYSKEYEMSVDREQVLRNICKCALKMDEALDVGDIKTYKDLSTTFDMMRKSGRFTEAQKTEESMREIDSLGEMVAYVEQKKGPIPKPNNPVKEPQDVIDFIVQDLKNYVDRLVREDLGLGDLIESFIKKTDTKRMNDVSDVMSHKFGASAIQQEIEVASRTYESFIKGEIEEQARRLAAGGVNRDGSFGPDSVG